MAWTKLRTAAVIGLGILLTAGTATVAVHHFAGRRVKSPEEVVQQFERQPGAVLTLETMKFSDTLGEQGRLPGFTKD